MTNLPIDRDYRGRARIKVTIDIDGVLGDFAIMYSWKAHQLFGTDPLEGQGDSKTFYIEETLGLTRDQGRKVWDSITHADWAVMEVIPTKEEIRTLNLYAKSFLYDVKMLTARREGIRDVTERWLKANNINHNGLVMRNDKGVYIAEHGVDIHLEDRSEQVIDARDAGALAFVRDWPYNRDVEGPGIIRVGDLHQFFDLVKMHRATLDTGVPM